MPYMKKKVMIRYWDYSSRYERDRVEILRICDRVFSSGTLILGPEVEAFEKEFAAFCGSAYGVGVNSGTDALFLALKALGIGERDEVITVSNTAVPTVAAIRAAGAVPVFADVEEDTFLINASLIDEAITGRTACIMPVHLFGQPADMPAIMAVAEKRGLKVIEDCAQAAGAEYQGRKVGSFGDIGAFSFYPTKVLGGYGDGGMAVTGNAGISEKLKRLRFYGMKEAYCSEEEGYNSRLDEVHAAILRFRLKNIDDEADARRQIAERYSERLDNVGDLILPSVRHDRTHQFYAYTIQTKSRDALIRHLSERGVETKINYAMPIHLMQGYAFLGYRRGQLPVTERLSEEIVSLPIYPGLSVQETDIVINAVREFFGELC